MKTLLVSSCLCLLMCQWAVADTIYVQDMNPGDGDQGTTVVTMLNNITGGATVSIDPTTRKLSVGPGGNAVAAQLRDMCESPYQATLDVGVNLPNVFVGAFQPPVFTNLQATTTLSNGHQQIDVSSLATLFADPNFSKMTPEAALFHEIVEVFQAVQFQLTYSQAHQRGIDAENMVLAIQGKSFLRTSAVVAPTPVAIPGGWEVRTPATDGDLGPGYVVWKLKSRPIAGQPGGSTALDWSYLGLESGLVDNLMFDNPDIYADEVFFEIPEPATLLLLALGGLAMIRSRRSA